VAGPSIDGRRLEPQCRVGPVFVVVRPLGVQHDLGLGELSAYPSCRPLEGRLSGCG
jgi:hypothetical protein